MDTNQPVGNFAGEQYALQLFEETVGRKGRSATIADAEGDLSFPKNNVFVDVSGATVLTRRALNVMNYLACSAPVEQLEFEYDVDYFKFLVNYPSRNHKHLVEALREAQKASVVVRRERSDGTAGGTNPEFVSIPLVGLVGLANGRVYFRFDPAMRKLHKTYRGYTFLSLRITSNFRSTYAHALYEKLKSVEFKGSPTEWLTVAEARTWMGAHDAKFMDEFKEFRRYALTVALQQINEMSDLYVEYETKTAQGSKKVTHLRFTFKEQEGAMVLSMRQTETRKTIYDTLKGEFGVGASDLQALMKDPETYTPEQIQEAIEFVRHRMANNTKKVRFPGRLFLKALKEGWTVPTAELKDQPKSVAAQVVRGNGAAEAVAQERTKALDAELRKAFERESEQGFKRYVESPAELRAELWASFTRTHRYRALKKQLSLDPFKDAAPDTMLLSNDRLRQAFGDHVRLALDKAAKKKALAAQTSLGLA
jgi:plasmid replication initiation protein